MCTKLPVWTLSLGLFLAAAPFSLSAQQGTLTGNVTDVETGLAIRAIEIRIIGGGQTRTVVTDAQGQYTVGLPAGRYDLAVDQALAYRDERFENVRVSAGETTTYDVILASDALAVAGISVTVGRSIDGQGPGRSPQTTTSVESYEIITRVNSNPTALLDRSPAVDIINSGTQSGFVVVRSFNNVFSGALHMLQDYRLAGVPSLRVNLMHFMPFVDEDMERIEVVLGPSSAL